jgi:hypothetical protein
LRQILGPKNSGPNAPFFFNQVLHRLAKNVWWSALLAIFPFKQVVIAKKPFSPHDVNDVNSVILCAIKNANWWNDKLAILCAFEFGGH